MADDKWQPIETAPWGVVIEVKNDFMEEPVFATRGYSRDGLVHPDASLFTSSYTPHRFFPTPAGQLICPTHWRPRPAQTPEEE